MKVLPNRSMFPANLERHFEPHPNFNSKTADYFKKKSDAFHVAQKVFVSEGTRKQ